MDRAELRTLVTETTWREPAEFGPRLIGAVWASLLSVFPIGNVIWVITGRNPFNDGGGPPGVLDWIFILVMGPLLSFTTAGFALYAVRRRSWIRLDATGVTRSVSSWRFWSHPSHTYQWNDCGEFSIRAVPVDGGTCAELAECDHVDGPLVLNTDDFGDPRDLVTIANAYRSAHRDAEAPAPVQHDRAEPDSGRARSPAAMRSREAIHLSGLTGPALRAAVVDTTWTSSPSHYKAAVGISGITFAVLIPIGRTHQPASDGPQLPDFAYIMFFGSIVAFCAAASAWYLAMCLRPPRVTLDSAGITVVGATPRTRAARLYRWDDCGTFAVHVTIGDPGTVVARCPLPSGHLKLDDAFGSPADLVTILNAYRSVHRSPEPL